MYSSDDEIPTLALHLKVATAQMHRRVERSTFMSRLLRGEIDCAGYVGLLHNLQALYLALEHALQRHAECAELAPVVLPELFRGRAIEHDLRALAAPPIAALCDATQHYVERLGELDRRAPGLLVAHAYVRYLGDLNGGQVLQRIVSRALGLQGRVGTAFYDFGDTAARQALATRFRAGLAALDALAPDRDAIVAEAVDAFRRHERMFEQLLPAG